MPDPSDLINRARAFDDSAWAAIFRAAYPRALEAAGCVCPPGCDPADLVGAAFLELVEMTPDFPSLEALIAWIEDRVRRAALPLHTPPALLPAAGTMPVRL